MSTQVGEEEVNLGDVELTSADFEEPAGTDEVEPESGGADVSATPADRSTSPPQYGAIGGSGDGEGGGGAGGAGVGPDGVEDGEDEFRFFARQFNSVLKPVCITMILVIWIVNQLSVIRRETQGGSYDTILVYHEKQSDSGGSKFSGALLNAMIFVGLILLVTVLFVILYKYRCLKVIYGWLIFSCVSLLGFFGGLTVWQLAEINDVPLDWLTLALFVWNFAAVGIMSIFWHAPLLLQQCYLVAVSALLAVNLTNLPEWTTWMLLAAVAVYDLFAVLAPKGPLKVLVETAQERQEPIPGLIYNAKVVRLGLGDFIFYSILVARGATVGDDTTVAACYAAILMGMCGTIGLLAVFKKALPALPFSIALGIVFYFLTRALVVPYVKEFSPRQVYI